MRDVGVYNFADFLNRLFSFVFQYDGVCHFNHNCLDTIITFLGRQK